MFRQLFNASQRSFIGASFLNTENLIPELLLNWKFSRVNFAIAIKTQKLIFMNIVAHHYNIITHDPNGRGYCVARATQLI